MKKVRSIIEYALLIFGVIFFSAMIYVVMTGD